MNRTVEYYDVDPEGYFERTFGSDTAAPRLIFASRLRPGARILDLGCGSCRDTVSFRRAGFEVYPADASEGIRRVVADRLGVVVHPLDYREMDFDSEFDGVWACASLLHSPSRELPGVLLRVRRALVPGGVFFCAFKLGSFEGVRESRWYTDLTLEALTGLLASAGFTVLESWDSEAGGYEWANAVAERPKTV